MWLVHSCCSIQPLNRPFVDLLGFSYPFALLLVSFRRVLKVAFVGLLLECVRLLFFAFVALSDVRCATVES